jgi:hypothetical protein
VVFSLHFLQANSGKLTPSKSPTSSSIIHSNRWWNNGSIVKQTTMKAGQLMFL